MLAPSVIVMTGDHAQDTGTASAACLDGAALAARLAAADLTALHDHDVIEHAAAVEFLGGISDEDKARLLSSVDVYCAPHTGGESFGIVLVEAMSAGATVVASDLGAFRRVLDDGEAGVLFPNGDSARLAETLVRVLRDPDLRRERAERARSVVRRYDWSVVTEQVLTVYETVLSCGPRVRVGEDPSSRRPGVPGEVTPP